jgi:hypothetical protein
MRSILWIAIGASLFAMAASAQQRQYWYYCDDPQGYFPYVRDCKSKWRAVDAAAEMERQRQEAAEKAERVRKEESAKAQAAELAAAKTAGYKTVAEYHAAQEAERQKREDQERQAAADAERERQAAAELKTATALGYVDAQAYRVALAERAELQRQAVNVGYDDLARNPTQHMGQIVHLIGHVVQVVYGGDRVVLRIEISRSVYGNWTNVIFCDYQRVSPTEPRILENDVVELWGVSEGITSYDAILGQTIEIPRVSAKFIQHLASMQSP